MSRRGTAVIVSEVKFKKPFAMDLTREFKTGRWVINPSRRKSIQRSFSDLKEATARRASDNKTSEDAYNDLVYAPFYYYIGMN